MRISNVHVVTNTEVLNNVSVDIVDGKIRSIDQRTTTDAINGKGMFLAPGAVDLHTHGSGGFDFMDGQESDIHGAAHGLAQFGTTTALATTLTSSDEELFKFLADLKTAQKNWTPKEARLPGAHLEGPYFDMIKKGAQDSRYIRNPEKSHYMSVMERAEGNIKRWSVAPELDGAMDFISDMVKEGVIISGGHTNADFATIGKAVDRGMSMMTHYYSAMSSMIKKGSWKVLGATEAGLYFDELTVELICDGCHLPADLLKLLFKIKRNDRIIGISDSMRGAGSESGESILGSKSNGTPVVIENGVAVLTDGSGLFAGSVATGIRLVKTLATLADQDLPTIFRTVSYNPAKLLGMEKEIGSIEVGKNADFMLFDKDFNLDSVYIAGEKV